MATKPEAPPANVEGLLSSLAEQLAIIGNRLDNLERKETRIIPSRPGGPQFGEVYGERQVVHDQLFPRAVRKYKSGDIVRMLPECDKFKTIKRSLETLVERKGDPVTKAVLDSMEDGTGPLGEVLSYLHTDSTTGTQKYRVKFPGIGNDGCLETEITLVRPR